MSIIVVVMRWEAYHQSSRVNDYSKGESFILRLTTVTHVIENPRHRCLGIFGEISATRKSHSYAKTHILEPACHLGHDRFCLRLPLQPNHLRLDRGIGHGYFRCL